MCDVAKMRIMNQTALLKKTFLRRLYRSAKTKFKISLISFYVLQDFSEVLISTYLYIISPFTNKVQIVKTSYKTNFR